MLHKKFLQQASFNQMQYLFKQQTIFKNVAITLKNMHAFLQAKQHYIYWEIRLIFEEHAAHVAQLLLHCAF